MVVERALREAWKIFQVFFKMNLKNKGIVILVMNTTGNLMDLLCV